MDTDVTSSAAPAEDSTDRADASYRALLAVAGMPAILSGMLLARIASTMATIVIVLFALAQYHSSALAGVITFVSLAPGIVVSPLAGALLDRHRRSVLVRLDYVLAAIAFLVLALLAATNALPAPLLILIVAGSALTTPLSASGLGSLFPLIVPEPLWERANASDSNTYVLATIAGPPLAAAAFQFAGGAAALAFVGLAYGAAGFVLRGIPEPRDRPPPQASVFRSAWHGLLFTVRNATLRGLGLSVACLNIAAGILVIAVPVLVVQRLAAPAWTVGLAWAVMGAAGVVSAVVVGRHDSRGRERIWLAGGMAGTAASIALLLLPVGLGAVLLALAGVGLANGLVDVALFTVRQRRTPRAWMGRAFAVSMAINSTGYPVGSAISGPLVGASVDVAVGVGIGACLLGAVLAYMLIPRLARPSGSVIAEQRMRSVNGRGRRRPAGTATG